MLPENAIAWAIDKVVAPRQLEPLVRQLLDGVVIFSKLGDALGCKKNDPSLAVATLNGEFISAEGVVFGGSATTKSDSLLERKAEISDLEKEVAGLLEERESLDQRRQDAEVAVSAVAENLTRSREHHQNAQISHSTANERIALRERERDDLLRKIESIQSEKATLEQQIAAADRHIAQLQNELAEARAQSTEHESKQSDAKGIQEKAAKSEIDLTEKINELRLTIATERQRQEHFVSQRAPMAAREMELTELIALRQEDIASYDQKISRQAAESDESRATIEKQTLCCKEAESSAEKIGGQRGTYLEAISQREAHLRQWRNSLSEMQDQRGQLQVRESQLQMQIDNLAENIERRYHVDIRAFAPDQPAFEKTLQVQLKRTEKAPAIDLGDDDLQKLIAELTRQLDNMGPVNLDAVQEYDELEERYKFLETQNTDLTNSRRELLDVIARINSTTKKLFAETFDQVRTNFREMFTELFGGGRADLSLMDENDPLNCGIEIVAKPPGKQLQSISLLSGGERAMTAVALLFSIYMVRPSPFCVLDEMDAPLDESNINRFLRMLDRFVAQSQFIIITHNKRTIAKADVLYGITMEERGVSKLVGMKMTAPPAAEQSAVSTATIPTQRQFSLVENGHSEHKASRAAR
jgi:chromosome segregation protein